MSVDKPRNGELILVIGTDRKETEPEGLCGRCVHRRLDDDGDVVCDVFGGVLTEPEYPGGKRPETLDERKPDRLRECMRSAVSYADYKGMGDAALLDAVKASEPMVKAADTEAVKAEPSSGAEKDPRVRLVVTPDIDLNSDFCDGCKYMDDGYCSLFQDNPAYDDDNGSYLRLDECQESEKALKRELREGGAGLTPEDKVRMKTVVELLERVNANDWTPYMQRMLGEGIALARKLSGES